MKYKLAHSSGFKSDYKKLNKRDKSLVNEVLERLMSGERLDFRHKDHALSGNLTGFRECHIRPDLLLIYSINENELILSALRVGKHSELFKGF